jgi:hypothetical protein
MGKTKDEVGYRKPPKKTQFQKGKSGNPKGRPKRTQENKTLQQMLRDQVLKEVPGQINGKKSKLTSLEVIFVRQLSEAMKGNTAATKLVFSLIEKHVPLNRTLAELMKDTPVFAWTAEDDARVEKTKLLEGVTYNEKGKD